MRRLLSVTETAALLDCSWRWDLAYGGHLAGNALTTRDTPAALREGRAWGLAMAALHTSGYLTEASDALRESIRTDAVERAEQGLDPDAAVTAEAFLSDCLAHYHHLASPLALYGAETELVIGLPAGSRRSSRYSLQAFLDGLHDDEHGTWIVEFKLRRSRILDYDLAVRDRQLRWYAWAWREHLGRDIRGVILDERIAAVPEAVRFNMDGKVSKVQSCTPEAYEAAGGEDWDVLQKLQARIWQERRRVTFRPSELDEVGGELRSVARLIHQYDTGRLSPIRNPSARTCGQCRFKAICEDPADVDLVDSLYDRHPPKRLRAV